MFVDCEPRQGLVCPGDQLTVVVDSREQQPLRFAGLAAEQRGTLKSGDYSLLGHEDRIAVERKSLPDLVGSLSAGRERLWREMERLSSLAAAALVVESPLRAVYEWRYRSKMHPSAVIGSCNAIMLDFGIPVIWAGDCGTAARWVVSFLRLAAKRPICGVCGKGSELVWLESDLDPAKPGAQGMCRRCSNERKQQICDDEIGGFGVTGIDSGCADK